MYLPFLVMGTRMDVVGTRVDVMGIRVDVMGIRVEVMGIVEEPMSRLRGACRDSGKSPMQRKGRSRVEIGALAFAFASSLWTCVAI